MKNLFLRKDSTLYIRIIRKIFYTIFYKSPERLQKRMINYAWKSEIGHGYLEDRIIDDYIVDLFAQEIDGDVVEIGTGNGYLINQLAYMLPYHFIGVDLNKNQIYINKKKYTDNSQLDFICDDVLNVAADYFISYISLVTFTPTMVRRQFKKCRKMILCERMGKKSMVGMSYNHDYIKLANEFNLEVKRKEIYKNYIFLVLEKID